MSSSRDFNVAKTEIIASFRTFKSVDLVTLVEDALQGKAIAMANLVERLAHLQNNEIPYAKTLLMYLQQKHRVIENPFLFTLLGLFYFYGYGNVVQIDYKKAQNLFAKANLASPLAMRMQALLLLKNINDARAKSLAFDILKIAAQRGDSRSLIELGDDETLTADERLYYHRNLMSLADGGNLHALVYAYYSYKKSNDIINTKKYLLLAACSGSTRAIMLLGLAYEFGEDGFEVDKEYAITLFELIKDGDSNPSSQARMKLAEHFTDKYGDGCIQAVELMEINVSQGGVDAALILISLHTNGIYHLTLKSLRTCINLLVKQRTTESNVNFGHFLMYMSKELESSNPHWVRDYRLLAFKLFLNWYLYSMSDDVTMREVCKSWLLTFLYDQPTETILSKLFTIFGNEDPRFYEQYSALQSRLLAMPLQGLSKIHVDMLSLYLQDKTCQPKDPEIKPAPQNYFKQLTNLQLEKYNTASKRINFWSDIPEKTSDNDKVLSHDGKITCWKLT